MLVWPAMFISAFVASAEAGANHSLHPDPETPSPIRSPNHKPQNFNKPKP